MEARNKLVIIGNGFDLAHGLKTSYVDFINWYLNDILSKISSHKFEDKIIGFFSKYNSQQLDNISKGRNMNSIDYFLNEIGLNSKRNFFSLIDESKKDFKVLNISLFLEKILANFKNYTWVDIETEYYKMLIDLYLRLRNNFNDFDSVLEDIKKLNIDFEFIKNKLEEYLATLKIESKLTEIDEIFKMNFGRTYHWESRKHIHYLNFNYTDTLKKYIPNDDTIFELNFIHGELNNEANPIIFGYGDELDEFYKQIENTNINEFLRNFKSFGYFKTENYSNLLSFINSEPYVVEILGHSCGLSDRVLLNTIFEHDNCQSIKIHYYQKSETENDFITKTQEISRHFKDKAKMRARIVDFTKCKPLVRYKG